MSELVEKAAKTADLITIKTYQPLDIERKLNLALVLVFHHTGSDLAESPNDIHTGNEIAFWRIRQRLQGALEVDVWLDVVEEI